MRIDTRMRRYGIAATMRDVELALYAMSFEERRSGYRLALEVADLQHVLSVDVARLTKAYTKNLRRLDKSHSAKAVQS